MIQYRRTFGHSTAIINGLVDDKGLITLAQKTTAGAPDTTAGIYQRACTIQNTADGELYSNTGTTAAPVWTVLGGGGGGSNIVYSNLLPTTGGAGITQIFNGLPNVQVGMIVSATVNTIGALPRTILAARVTAPGQVTVFFNNDPETDHIVNLVVTQEVA